MSYGCRVWWVEKKFCVRCCVCENRLYICIIKTNKPQTHTTMKITFTNNFTEIANAGDATNVGVTVANLIARTRGIIEGMYPDADITVNDRTIMRAHCIVTIEDATDGTVELEDDASEIIACYNEYEMSDCWV
jgi:hypothetical protein